MIAEDHISEIKSRYENEPFDLPPEPEPLRKAKKSNRAAAPNYEAWLKNHEAKNTQKQAK